MPARHLVPALLLCGLMACAAEPPQFPSEAPGHIGNEKERPPESHPVASFGVTPDAQMRVIFVVLAGAGAFLLVLVIAFFSARDAVVPASLPAALLGPIVAIAMSVRQLPLMLMKTRDPGALLAQLSLDLWNANQPLLYALYAAAVCLLILAIVARRDGPGSAGLAVLSIAILAASSIAFLLNLSVNRMIVAVADPFTTDAIVQPYKSTSIAHVAQTLSNRIIAAFALSLGTLSLVLLAIAFGFALRRKMRAGIWLVLIALVLVASAAFFDHSWCELLETTAETGHIPA